MPEAAETYADLRCQRSPNASRLFWTCQEGFCKRTSNLPNLRDGVFGGRKTLQHTAFVQPSDNLLSNPYAPPKSSICSATCPFRSRHPDLKNMCPMLKGSTRVIAVAVWDVVSRLFTREKKISGRRVPPSLVGAQTDAQHSLVVRCAEDVAALEIKKNVCCFPKNNCFRARI